MQQAILSASQLQSPLLIPEEFSVTLQVAIIGTDGLALGSDRLFVESRQLPKFGVHIAERHTQTSINRKILASGDKPVACGFAGSSDAEKIARAIYLQGEPLGLSDEEWGSQIQEIADSVSRLDSSVIDEVFIVRTDEQKSVWKYMRQGVQGSSMQLIQDYSLSGDITQPCRFIPTHFRSANMSLEDIVPLILLTIAYGSTENPSGIGGGADVLTLDSDHEFKLCTYQQSDLEDIRQTFQKHLEGIIRIENRFKNIRRSSPMDDPQ